MQTDWMSELASIIPLAIVFTVIIVFFIIKKSKNAESSSEPIKKFNLSPGEFFLFNYGWGFFCFSIIIDILDLFTHRNDITRSLRYLFPLLMAFIMYLKQKHPYLFKNTEGEKL